MRFLPKFGHWKSSCRNVEEHVEAAPVQGASFDEAELEESHLLKTVGWVSAALGAVALGLIVGRELRLRYKFNRQTPYDLYAHSGDQLADVDCSVGI